MKPALKLLGLGAAACAACCAAPLAALIGGAAAGAGLGGVLGGGAIAGTVALAAVAAGGAWMLHRKSQALATAGASCGCTAPAPLSLPDRAPIACTLGGDDYKQRTAFIRELAQRALISSERDALTLRLTYAADAEAEVRRLVSQEQGCCAFLSFDMRKDQNGVHVVIRAPDEARAAADDLFAHFAPALMDRSARAPQIA